MYSPTDDFQTAVRGTFLPPPDGALPEPSAWALLIAGFGAVGMALRRRVSVLPVG
jgi:hypothetical protein